MRVIKVLLTLIIAVVFGFVIHNNWAWLNKAEPIVFFTYSYDKAPETAPPAENQSARPLAPDPRKMEYRLQTIPLPIWVYILGALFLGAIFVAIGSLRDIYINRRDKKAALSELEELQSRYGSSRGAGKRDSTYLSDASESDDGR